jgi:hypothetical protein
MMNDTKLHNPYVRRWDAEGGETYYEHRAVAEEKLGRPLRTGEVVSHEEQNKSNNQPDNTVVFFEPTRPHTLRELLPKRKGRGEAPFQH